MSMRFLVRGTATLACAALASSGLLLPATAGPAVSAAPGLSSTAFQKFAPQPHLPTVPSEEDIAKAKKSEAATAAAAAELEAILATANDRLRATSMAALSASGSYTEALVVLEQRQEEAATAKGKSEAARSAHSKAKTQLGQLAGNLYKSGGVGLSVQTLLTSDEGDDALYQASTLMALSSNRANTFASAEAAAATSAALDAQALAASTAATEATTAAEASRAQAQGAADAQAAVVAENQSQRDILLTRLASLHNTTVELEGARVDELTRKAEEEALKEQIEASADTPAPVRPPATGTKPPALPPVPKPPVTQAPKPQAPKPPAPTTSAPRPPAPKPPVAPKPPAPKPPVAPKPPAPKPPVAPKPPAPKPPAPKPPVAPPTGSYTQVMVNYALSKIGSRYQWGGNGPNAFDCSGLVQQAFAAAGKSVPRQGSDQFWAAPVRVPLSQMQYGDLLVFDDDGNGRFGHVAIYIGNNQVVQALNYTQPVEITPLSHMTPYMSLYPYAARY
ncbi:cell wall-associated NlpC family hydrolase [Arthrobacter sp. UYCu511]|uniref:C40 family peptidase n=1 Tax=unclassified Arthrobacter TaxID=235627 RepID=UPI0028F6EDFD|nr:C40 family peptidase [Arthrobacter sp. lap29]